MFVIWLAWPTLAPTVPAASPHSWVASSTRADSRLLAAPCLFFLRPPVSELQRVASTWLAHYDSNSSLRRTHFRSGETLLFLLGCNTVAYNFPDVPLQRTAASLTAVWICLIHPDCPLCASVGCHTYFLLSPSVLPILTLHRFHTFLPIASTTHTPFASPRCSLASSHSFHPERQLQVLAASPFSCAVTTTNSSTAIRHLCSTCLTCPRSS